MLDAKEIWRRCLEVLSGRLAARTLDTLLRPLVPVRCEVDGLGGILALEASNDFAKEWTSRNYGRVVEEVLAQVTGTAFSVHWSVAQPAPPAELRPDDPSSAAPRKSTATAPRRIAARTVPSTDRAAPAAVARLFPDTAPVTAAPDRTQASHAPENARSDAPVAAPAPREPNLLRSRFTFDAFVVGPSNALAHAAARSMAEPHPRVNPLFVCGATGLGKTHLLHAIGHGILARKPDAVVAYVSAERFTNEFVHAVQRRAMHEFRARYRGGVDALLLDDVQFFAGKEQTVDEFFHTFNALFEREVPVAVSSDVMPQDLKGMPERLVSRFASGLVAELYPPGLETRIAIVLSRAQAEGLEVTGEAAERLAEAVTTNVRELEGALMRLAVRASLEGRSAVDLSLVERVLQLSPRSAGIGVEDIQRAVCAHYRVKQGELLGRDRHAHIALARQVAMFLCRTRLGTSYPQLGARFGGKDHTTALAAVRKIEKLVAADHPVRKDLEAIVLRLGGGK